MFSLKGFHFNNQMITAKTLKNFKSSWFLKKTCRNFTQRKKNCLGLPHAVSLCQQTLSSYGADRKGRDVAQARSLQSRRGGRASPRIFMGGTVHEERRVTWNKVRKRQSVQIAELPICKNRPGRVKTAAAANNSSDAPDGMFYKFIGFVSHVHLGQKSLKKTEGETR